MKSHGASPSHGMLKKMFNPDKFKKKEKAALGVSKAGGNDIQKQTVGRFKGGKK